MTATGFEAVEQLMADSAKNYVFGGTEMIGVMILAFFTGFVMLQPTRMEVKMMIMLPAAIMSAAFLPILRIPIALGFGILVAAAIVRVWLK